MQRLSIVVVVLACALAVVAGQDHPDFSGTWELDIAKSPKPDDRGWTLRRATTLVIAQTARQLTIESRGDRPREPERYDLDGLEHVTRPPLSPPLSLRAQWEGSTLRTIRNDGQSPFQSTLSLSANGRELRVDDAIRLDFSGPRRTQQVYVKREVKAAATQGAKAKVAANALVGTWAVSIKEMNTSARPGPEERIYRLTVNRAASGEPGMKAELFYHDFRTSADKGETLVDFANTYKGPVNLVSTGVYAFRPLVV
jgi:hypothetical protein